MLETSNDYGKKQQRSIRLLPTQVPQVAVPLILCSNFIKFSVVLYINIAASRELFRSGIVGSVYS